MRLLTLAFLLLCSSTSFAKVFTAVVEDVKCTTVYNNQKVCVVFLINKGQQHNNKKAVVFDAQKFQQYIGQELGTKVSHLQNQLVVLEMDEVRHVANFNLANSLRKLNDQYFYFITEDNGEYALDFFQLTP